MAEEKKYYIRVRGALVQVTAKVYKEWHQARRVEDIVMNRLLRKKLRCCLSQLTTEERSLICALFYEQKTEREYAEILGISQKAVNKRRYKVLTKLYRLMKA